MATAGERSRTLHFHFVTLHMSVFPCQQRGHRGSLRAAEARERGASEERREEEGGGGEGGVLWWLWETFLGVSLEVMLTESCRRKTSHPSVFVHHHFSPHRLSNINIKAHYEEIFSQICSDPGHCCPHPSLQRSSPPQPNSGSITSAACCL